MKNSFLDQVTNLTTTQNGALTNKSSLNPVLDLFSMGVSSSNKAELIKAALLTDPVLATKTVMYLRDVRNGQGNKDIMRTYHSVVNDLVSYDPFYSKYIKLLPYLPEIGSWKDVYNLYTSTSSELLRAEILDLVHLNLEKSQLCAKWFPRQSQFHRDFAAKFYDSDLGQVRRLVAKVTKVVETQMCNREWSSINYDHVPSRANFIYSKAFLRNDTDRRGAYLQKAITAPESVSMKASTLYPHEIAATAYRTHDLTMEALWKALPDYMEGSEHFNVLPVIDVSGSMTTTAYGNYSCMDISTGLGAYFSTRNKGDYKDIYCTFADHPEFVRIKSNNSIRDIIRTMRSTKVGYSTNLQAVFDLILKTAKKSLASELPKVVLIISDMEFNDPDVNGYQRKTNFETIKAKYEKAGLVMPTLVFWRVDVKVPQQPVTMDDSGTILINGYSPSFVKILLSLSLEELKEYTPLGVMMKTLNERYPFVDEIFGA